MDDLVRRLRANALDECDEAVDRIEALEARVAGADKLAEALQLTHAALSGANMNMKVVESKARTALAAYQATKEG